MNLENNKPQCDEFVVYCTWFIKSKIYIQENSPVHENIFNSLLANNNLSQMKWNKTLFICMGNSNDNQYPSKKR